MNLIKTISLFFVSAITLTMTSCGEKDEPESIPEVKVLEQEIKFAALDASDTDVTFSATENWKSTSDAAWCTVNPSQGISGASKKITIHAADNTSKEARVAHVTVKTVAGGKTIANITVLQSGYVEKPSYDVDPNAPEGMKSTNAGLVKKIKVGWNLGNTCEAGIWDGWNDDDLNIETNWINPKVKTSKEMFTALKKAGFNAIRIPVRWYVHADGNLNINDRWMARVKEIVDYAISQDMYVILNSHHDNWYDRLPIGYNESDIHIKFKNMWTQIATTFKDYDEHLIFAGVNEIIKLNAKGEEDWGTPNDQNFKFVNDLMQLFVNTVRATGGNNEWRCLMVQPWACNPANAVSDKFVLPTDTKNDRLILEFHCYDPYDYATPKKKHEVTDAEFMAIKGTLNTLNRKFVMKNIPCIMAEFGSTQDNTHPSGNAKADEIRANYHKFIVSSAKPYDMPCFYWDNYCFETTGENFGLFDRKNLNFPARAKVALQGIMDGLK